MQVRDLLPQVDGEASAPQVPGDQSCTSPNSTSDWCTMTEAFAFPRNTGRFPRVGWGGKTRNLCREVCFLFSPEAVPLSLLCDPSRGTPRRWLCFLAIPSLHLCQLKGKHQPDLPPLLPAQGSPQSQHFAAVAVFYALHFKCSAMYFPLQVTRCCHLSH